MTDAIRYTFPLFAFAMLAAGCTETPGEITRDTAPFDGIAPTASVSVSGTEPFWNIAIEPEGETFTATYSDPENIEGSSFVASRFAGNNGVGFSGELAGQTVRIALTPGDCNDAMSERTYPYVAMVEIGDTELSGCAYTSDEPYVGDEAP